MSSISVEIDTSKIQAICNEEIEKLKKQLASKYEPYKKKVDDFMLNFFDCVADNDECGEDEELPETFSCFVAGGALTSSFTKKEIKDFDIYFYNEKDFNFANASFSGWKATELAKTQRAVTYNRSGEVFQLIKLFGTPEEVFEMYDFTINMCALKYKYNFKTSTMESEFVFDDRFFLDNMSKSLVFNKGTLYPINSLFRVKKYQERGYNINTIEMMKIALRISQMKIETIGDIKNQVTGLSSDVMNELTEKLASFPDTERVEDPIQFIQDVYDGLINKDSFKNDVGATADKPVQPVHAPVPVFPEGVSCED